MGVLQALVSYIGVPWLGNFKSSWNPFAVSQISTHRNPHFTSTTCFKPVFPINLPWFRFISFHTKFSPTPSFPIIDRPRRASKREIQLGSSASSNSSAACCWSGRTMPPLPLSKPLRGHQRWKRHRWFHRKLRRCPRFPRQDRRPGWYYWVGSTTLCDPKILVHILALSSSGLHGFWRETGWLELQNYPPHAPILDLKHAFGFVVS